MQGQRLRQLLSLLARRDGLSAAQAAAGCEAGFRGAPTPRAALRQPPAPPAPPGLLLARGLAQKPRRPAAAEEHARLELRKNGEISADPVRLVGADEHGVVSLADALAQARAAGLDLVEVAPRAVPPVCRITSFAAMASASVKSQVDAKEKQRKLQARDSARTKEIRVG